MAKKKAVMACRFYQHCHGAPPTLPTNPTKRTNPLTRKTRANTGATLNFSS